METTIILTSDNVTDDQPEQTICELTNLIEMMGAKKSLIKGIMDAFLLQIPEELININNAIEEADYPVIKSLSHSMKSSLSIMGVSLAMPILTEMESLGAEGLGIEKIKELNTSLNILCNQAIGEIEKEKFNYA